MKRISLFLAVLFTVVSIFSFCNTNAYAANPRFDIAGFSWPEYFGTQGNFYTVPNFTYGAAQATPVTSSTVYIVVKTSLLINSFGIQIDNFENCTYKLLGSYPIVSGGVATTTYRVYSITNVSPGTHRFWVWGPWNSESEGVDRSRMQKFDVVTLNVQY